MSDGASTASKVNKACRIHPTTETAIKGQPTWRLPVLPACQGGIPNDWGGSPASVASVQGARGAGVVYEGARTKAYTCHEAIQNQLKTHSIHSVSKGLHQIFMNFTVPQENYWKNLTFSNKSMFDKSDKAPIEPLAHIQNKLGLYVYKHDTVSLIHLKHS